MFVNALPKVFQNFHNICQIVSKNLSTSPALPDKGVPSKQELSLDGNSAKYLEKMYNAWMKDAESVHKSWDVYFSNGGNTRPSTSSSSTIGYLSPPASSPSVADPVPFSPHKSHSPLPPITSALPHTISTPTELQGNMEVQCIIRDYQVKGHLAALVNPLADMFDIADTTTTISEKLGGFPKEVVAHHMIDPSMMTRVFTLPSYTKIGGQEGKLPLKEIIRRLELVYCRHIGLEYSHINDAEQVAFIRERFEMPGAFNLSKLEKRFMFSGLAEAVFFEKFCKKRWATQKRFGIEGGEVTIPCLRTVIDEFAKKNGEVAIIGMSHRGRLNILANIAMKPLRYIFSQFRSLPAADVKAADVKYHLGSYHKGEHPITRKPFTTVLLANPSHLEVINSVVAGRAKAEMFALGDEAGDKVITILCHGDASICGEGSVYEAINMSTLENYHTGGTVHVVVNNQVGFATDPKYSRSFRYPTDVAKCLEAPIFHVNGDDPDSVMYVAKVAAEFRSRFHKDVFIDIVCYRLHGHNEMDEPRFTQPFMYKIISKMENVFEKYSRAAIKQGITTQQDIDAYVAQYDKLLETEFEESAKETKVTFADWIDSPWKGFFKNKNQNKCEPTGITMDVMEHIAKKFSSPPPEGFQLHKTLQRTMKGRQVLVKQQIADWAIAEALALGSLLKEGYHVRMSGEDVERGTFSHRHHMVHHQDKPNTRYQYLTDLYSDQAIYTVSNSPVSEYGVLAFEHGYSMARPNYMVLWEAQFGDFANNGQTIFDCMIASGEAKWMRQCGMVALLPHGLDGQEHSSSRIERYLQLCDDDPDYMPPEDSDYAVKQLREINWIIANCTTPANLFHIWRRQMKLPFRKPLMLFGPKSLLRHPDCRSKFDDMKEGTEFHRLIPASSPDPGNVKRLIFVCGKVFYEFMDEIKMKNMEDKIVISRIEQVCPFPYDLVQKEGERFSNAEIIWGQEEHKNSGCWTYVQPRLETAFKGKRPIRYIGRAPSAATASGNKIQYDAAYTKFMDSVTKNIE